MITIEEAAKLLETEIREQSKARVDAIAAVRDSINSYEGKLKGAILAGIMSRLRGEAFDKSPLEDAAMALHSAAERVLEIEMGGSVSPSATRSMDEDEPDSMVDLRCEAADNGPVASCSTSETPSAAKTSSEMPDSLAKMVAISAQRPVLLYGAANNTIPKEKVEYLRSIGLNFEWMETRDLSRFEKLAGKGPSVHSGAVIFTGQMGHNDFNRAKDACRRAGVPYRACEKIGHGQLVGALSALWEHSGARRE